MQCPEDNDPDIKENDLKTLGPEIDLHKLSDTTNVICEKESIDTEIDESSSSDDTVMNLTSLSLVSIKTFIVRALIEENHEENQSCKQNNEEIVTKSISREIVNIDLNEDTSNNNKDNYLIIEAKQLTKFFDDTPQTCTSKKPETENLDTCCTKSSETALSFLSYTNLDYEILASKSLCTLDKSLNKSVRNSAKKIFCQGDIINVNTAQIKTTFNTCHKPLQLNNQSELVIRENRAIATNLKNIVSELASSFSICSSSKIGSFSSSIDYNISDVSNTTLTAPNASDMLIINSSSLFNQICLESDQKLGRQHRKTITINDTNKKEFSERNDTQTSLQKNNESEKFSFINKSEVAALSVKLQSPDFYKKKHVVHSESNIQRDFRLDFTGITCMKSVLSGTEDLSDAEEFKLKFTKNELWETLILALDITAKRLEDTLSERIVSKVNKSLNILSKSINLPTPQNNDVKAETKVIGDNLIEHYELVDDKTLLAEKTTSELEIDACLQCNLVSKSFIDEHMQKLKFENYKNQSKVKETKIVIDNLAGQTLSVKQCSLETVIKDSPTVLTKALTDKKGDRLRRFKTMLHNSCRFVVENALVIISVPSFLFVLFLLYGVILLAMKPW